MSTFCQDSSYVTGVESVDPYVLARRLGEHLGFPIQKVEPIFRVDKGGRKHLLHYRFEFQNPDHVIIRNYRVKNGEGTIWEPDTK